ncbi:ubiquitin carboxyl-terminal hydrolase [Biscogniauxia marginata]|nr:ubiquitin carboxyl-terminal hydrolase [Biscogniauxia marginata]
MDQDSRSSESRERAVSSEPSSTRPNPFDDGDLSARKRRRTSLSASRSTSVETLRSQDDRLPVSESNDMKVDTPEPVPPSTPARSEPPNEPVSSKVTINLRNVDSLQATPTSPVSPTPAPIRSDDVRLSVEESEVNMTRSRPVGNAPSSPCAPNTLEDPIVVLDDDDDELEEISAPEPQAALLEAGRAAQFGAAMLDFPYHSDGEPYHETIGRLVNYFRQQPPNADEALFAIQNWLGRYVSYADIDMYSLVIEVYQENRLFWQALPELFYLIFHRQSYTKIREMRDMLTQIVGLYARLTAFLLAVDCRTLEFVATTEGTELDLMSPNFMRFFGHMMLRDENHLVNGYGSDGSSDLLETLEQFQKGPGGPSVAKLVRFAELHRGILLRFPKKTMENLSASSIVMSSIVRESYQKPSFVAGLPQSILDRSRANLALGHRFFNIVSSTLAVVVEKSINHLAQEIASNITGCLTEILRYSLHGSHTEAAELVQGHRQEHPGVAPQFTYEAISLEWRFGVFCGLVRSRQMQLRVTAVNQMCEDLVAQWKKFQDRQELPEEIHPHLDYLRHLSDYIMRTRIVDYILGPTCHPEISQASFNIVGFLAVTKTYTAAHTELLWQTLTSTQDPRISEALVRMMLRVIALLHEDCLSYFLEKFQGVSIDSFTPFIRDLFDSVTKNFLRHKPLPLASFEVCVRLLRESSVYGPRGSIAYPDIHQFALAKFKEFLTSGLDPDDRQTISMSCLRDIEAKSPTTPGSLQVLGILMGQPLGFQSLVTEHDLTRLLIDELESTIEAAKVVGFTPVYANHVSQARRKFISNIIMQYGSTIGSDLGQRLWDLLVGDGAACQEDRRAAWEDLYLALRRTGLDNPFLNACLREYLPRLPPQCYCSGSLNFVREALVPPANDVVNGVILDDEESIKSAGLELLWQMILTAPNQTIEDSAILTLVNDIYVDSKVILSYPLQRARKVHFNLVQRCLHQLKSAAQKLKTFNDGTTNGDDEPMAIVITNDQHREQEMQFTRSLKVLISLLRTLQTRSHFAAPDLRSLMLETPNAVAGDLADLKYQSFDGNQQSEVNSLEIGLKNSAASLLATLRDVTGFENYRLYYRGQAFAPSDTDICKSLEDLGIKNGLILVKKELDVASSPVRIKPGASPLDIEILSHFTDLWEYLSMEERLAREIYQFLISLPADDSILAAFENPDTSHRDVFPLGQPFKCLYALHALREYLSTRRLKNSVMQLSGKDSENRQKTAGDQEDALVKAMSLIVSAICDPNVIGKCSSEGLRLLLSLQLVENFVQLLKETMNLAAISELLTPTLHERLMGILESASTAETSQFSVDLVSRSFEALLESCAKSHEFWIIFRDQVPVQQVIQSLLLDDRPFIRKNIAKLIGTRSFYNNGPSGVLAIDFAEVFWPVVFQLLPRAVGEPRKCEEVFNLSFQLLRKLVEGSSSILDLPSCLETCGQLLVSHTATEDIAYPDQVDIVAHGLITILFHGIKHMSAKKGDIKFPPGFAQKLFARHLFPPEDEDGPLVPQVVLHPASRNMLYEIILLLVKDDTSQSIALLQDFDTLTSHRKVEGVEVYKYDLPQLFDRANAIRSPCGYAGLKNLSNTCYLNSLFTQLFMNIGFRRFILSIQVGNPNSHRHQLLHETRALFAFLQDSRRRFIDPQGCVDQITTYEELPIDIHNQMDVDEFYSLLFDRWEVQLPSEPDKKALRSIYGGQLVQQVKSKECEHISERIEPFSAIQCDIKGKTSLEESLQAYVDGEIMEGDNKYKCSDCDRHVDAVKRACLKDMPDNLIFHLKRFDFNLRTLQRSKINDFFRFPSKINMQPYTIEHLSDPSRNTEPDMFELVGVLVHSGTAESGHYYSFIRERPSTHNPPSWVEFNDEIVTAWDPSQMENACFGGPDYRPQFDTGGAYEKVYSAYMLFYQRSSSLRKEQEILGVSGISSPLRSDLSPELEYQVKEDNWGIVQRHCLYDPTHIPFVQRVLASVWGTRCSKDHKKENLAMRVALGHLDQVASRAKDLPDFETLKNLIVRVCQRCPLCCYAFFDYFSVHKEAFRMLLQRNSDPTVRHDIGQTLIFVLKNIKAAYPDEYGIGKCEEDGNSSPDSGGSSNNVMEMTAEIFLYLWETFHNRLVSWPEYFGTMVEFAQLGHLEASMLLDKDFLLKTLMVIIADHALDLPAQYARLLTIVSRRMATRPPNYENVIALIDVLMDVMYKDDLSYSLEHAHGRFAIAQNKHDLVPYTAQEINILHKEWGRTQANVFADKLIQLNQNPAATCSIISRLMGLDPLLDDTIFATLRAGITGQLVAHMVSPYLRVAVLYCENSTSEENVRQLINHVSNQCRNLQNAEGRAFFEFERDVYEGPRSTQESDESIQIQSLHNLPIWVPGLLGCIDRTVSSDVEKFLQEKLFKHGPSLAFGETHSGFAISREMNSAARRLAIRCLLYLRDTYVIRSAQAARDNVVPLDRVIKQCDQYFKVDEDMNDGLDGQYSELCQTVLESMDRLTVDEIEEDGSDWEQSVGSSEQMDSLADLSMQVDRDIPEGNV